MGHGGRDGRERGLYLVIPPVDDSLPAWTNTDLDRESQDRADSPAPVETEGDGGLVSLPPEMGPPASVSLPSFFTNLEHAADLVKGACDHQGELHQFTETCSCGHVINSYSSLEGNV